MFKTINSMNSWPQPFSKSYFKCMQSFMNIEHFVSLLYTIIFWFSVLCIQSCFSLKLALVTDSSLWFEAHNFLPIAFFSVFFSQILMKLLLLGVCQRTKSHGEWKVDFGWGDGIVPPSLQHGLFYTSLH